MLIFDRFYRKTVLPQPNGGFFKETELRGFVLFVHCEVLLVSKKIGIMYNKLRKLENA